MSDQAKKLRELMQAFSPAVDEPRGATPMLVVTGARAGVGATTVALNLAAVLADHGERVLLAEGVTERESYTKPNVLGAVKFGYADVLGGKCTIEDAIVDGPAGIKILLASSNNVMRGGLGGRAFGKPSGARNSPTSCPRRMSQGLAHNLQSLAGAFDRVVVDAGHGLSATARQLWPTALLNVLVTTPDDAAVLDAYAVLKHLVTELPTAPVRLLVNQADNDAEAKSAERRLANSCERFLSRSIAALPALPRHAESDYASANTAPRVWEAPNTEFGHAALWLGRAVSEILASEDAGCGTRPAVSSSTSSFKTVCREGDSPNFPRGLGRIGTVPEHSPLY